MKLGEMVLLNPILSVLVLVVVMLIDFVKLGFLSLTLFLRTNLVSLRTWVFLAFYLLVGAVHRNFDLLNRGYNRNEFQFQPGAKGDAMGLQDLHQVRKGSSSGSSEEVLKKFIWDIEG